MSLTNNTIEYENLQKLNFEFEIKFREKLVKFLDEGWYILGNEVKDFECNFAAYCGAKYCVGVANGLDAITLGLKVFEFPEKSEIIVPSNTYIATILAIMNAGHIPILVEPKIESYNLDPSLIEDKISAKTKAILAVHLYGQIAQMDEICSIAEKYHLQIIEDCAQAHGSIFKGKMAGTFGKIGAYSFYPTKNLGALGDAGAIITSDKDLYKKLKALRNYGSEKKYYNKYIGFNSRLDELQAAFLNVKLPYLNKIIEHKRELAAMYNSLLTDEVIKPVEIKDAFHVYHIYNIRTKERDKLKEYLLQKRIKTEIHYPVPPHKQKGFIKTLNSNKLPICEEIHSTTLSLPISFSNTKKEIITVIKAINSFY